MSLTTPEEFVSQYMEAYRRGESVQELADRLGRPKTSVQSKVGKFRSIGVKLPSLHKKREIDVAGLNRLIEQGVKSRPPTESTAKAAFCSHCRAFTTHNSRNHPIDPEAEPAAADDFLPGYEKTPEEKKDWAKLHKDSVQSLSNRPDALKRKPLA